MSIELCNPHANIQARMAYFIWQKIIERASLLFFWNLVKQKRGEVAGDKEVWDTYIYTLEQVEEKQQTLWA
jgi:hypothetical protein